jgi:hypothetical protein
MHPKNHNIQTKKLKRNNREGRQMENECHHLHRGLQQKSVWLSRKQQLSMYIQLD